MYQGLGSYFIRWKAGITGYIGRNEHFPCPTVNIFKRLLPFNDKVAVRLFFFSLMGIILLEQVAITAWKMRKSQVEEQLKTSSFIFVDK